jgi:hypothetical protein
MGWRGRERETGGGAARERCSDRGRIEKEEEKEEEKVRERWKRVWGEKRRWEKGLGLTG